MFSSVMEIAQLSPNVAKVPKNLRCLLIGASEAGKLTWIASLIKNKATIFHQPGYSKFIYCSPNFGKSALNSAGDLSYQNKLKEWAQPVEIIFVDHILTEEELFEEADATSGRILLIVDDFSQEMFSTSLVYRLFTRLSSHNGIDTCISLHQGAASKAFGKWYTLVQQNSNFLVLFRNIANRAAIGKISQQIFPRSKNFLQRCLDEVTNICGTYSYIFVDADLKNPLNIKFGVRANIFEENNLPMLMMKNPPTYH